jgi:2-keto-3-deoxy-L-rhamnonate aldolase RhmA
MKKRLCITPCGAAKIWDKHPELGGVQAKDAYISPFGTACHTYADIFFEHWVILSAKHGFLFPTDIVPGNYDLAFNSGSPDVITVEALKQQAAEKGLDVFEEIVVVAGKKHIKVVQQVFGANRAYRFPLQGCRGIGYMLQKLNNAIQQNKEIEGE